MNILLTDKCSNNCPYCFAQEKLEADSKLNQMPLDNYRKVLDFLKKSRNRTVKLLGGEPMLHSQISEIIKMTAEDDDFDNIIIFTGGIFDRNLVHLLTNEKISVVLNTNHPDDYKENKWEIYMGNLDYMISLGIHVTPGYNIYREDFDYEFILDLLEHYKLKNLRWTVAVPMGSYGNAHVSLDNYRRMGKRLTEFLLRVSDLGVRASLDCFVPLCTFSDSDYGKLIKFFPQMAKGGFCSPAIDVGPDLTVWRCFAVSSYENVSLEKFPDLKSLRNYFLSTFDHYKWHIYPKRCEKCKYKTARICHASCLSFKAGEIDEFVRQEREAKVIVKEAEELFASGKFEEAIIKYEKALSQAPYSLEIRAGAALCYINAGQIVPAAKLLDEIEAEYPEYPALHVYRSFMYEAVKDYTKAIASLRKALQICPKDEKLKERIDRLRSAQIMSMSLF